MFKAKLTGLAIACMIGVLGTSPISVLASETNSESVTLSEKSKDNQDKKSAFDDAMKKANDKWNTLSDKQKAEVYDLLENEMKAEFKLMDKLADLGVINKNDVKAMKTRMQGKLDELKQSGEFPLSRPKREKNQK